MKVLYITQRITKEASYQETRDTLDLAWYEFVSKALPDWVIFPVPNHLESIKKMYLINPPNGIILTGGNDIGEFKARENVEDFLLNQSIKVKIPVLGVCRGCQKIATHLGAQIIDANPLLHVAKCHQIHNKSSLSMPNLVNSYHNKQIKINSNFKGQVLATSNDNCIEAIENKQKNWLGIMWHPERKLAKDDINNCIFNIFFAR